MWNEFIDLPERQQDHIVKLAKKNKKNRRARVGDSVTTNSCSSDESVETFVLIENRATTDDQPSVDPLRRQGIFLEFKFSNTFYRFPEEAETCFHHIDSNIRCTLKSMIKRHHLPLVNISKYFHSIPI